MAAGCEELLDPVRKSLSTIGGLGWVIWWNWTSGARMHECGGRPELNCFNFGLEICAHWNKKMRFMVVVLDFVGVKL